MKLLIKMPTRGRPEQALKVLDKLILTSKEKADNTYLLTLDEDDPYALGMIKTFLVYNMFGNNIKWVIGKSENKIHAVNRDLDKFTDWDVLVLTSDDMLPVFEGWDVQIKKAFEKIGLDAVLYTPDGYTQLNTLPIMGREYYNRFNYIYNPIYKSFFCDNEFHIVAEVLKKHYKLAGTTILFRHEHPANNQRIANDALYIENNKYWDEDQDTFEQRKKANFGLGEGYEIFNNDSSDRREEGTA